MDLKAFLSLFLFFNKDISINIKVFKLRFSVCVLKVPLRGSMSQFLLYRSYFVLYIKDPFQKLLYVVKLSGPLRDIGTKTKTRPVGNHINPAKYLRDQETRLALE